MSAADRAAPTAAQTASTVGPAARAAVFQALRPPLEALAREAAADLRLSAPARRTLRAVVRTRPQDSLALPALAARGSTPKTCVPSALAELEAHGYLTQLARIAPHLAAALPAPAPSAPASIGVTGGSHDQRP